MASAVRRRALSLTAAVALLALMLGLSVDFGATWDERFQQKLGERTWDYVTGALPRSAFEDTSTTDFMYGGLVDVLCVAAQHILPLDTYIVRHFVIACFGWLGVVAVWLLGSRVFGARVGWMAAALLILSPRYLGHSMNNPKDIPFAAAMCLGLYFILTMKREYPFVDRRSGVGLAVAVALALNMRSLGLLLFGFAGIGLAVFAWLSGERSPRRLALAAARLLVVMLCALMAGTAFWPWAQAHPLVRPFQAFLFASRFDWITDPPSPWYYAPMWLGITVPPVVLAGGLLSLLGAAVQRSVPGRVVAPAWQRRHTLGLVALWVFVLLPIVLGILRDAKYYDGIRHLLFVVPALTAVAAVGWSWALDATRGRLKVGVAVLLGIGACEPFVFQLRNHPNQVVYFNALVGGPRGAFGNLEMDYWGNCMLQSVEWGAAVAEKAGMPVAVWGNPPAVTEADVKRFPALWFAPRRAGDEYHLDMRLLRGPRQSVMEFALRPDVLHAVRMSDGTPLCVTIPGPRYWELEARLRRLGAIP